VSSINDNIRVGVVHGPGGRIQPVWFDLNRRKYRIREITNSWRERSGTVDLLHFHVTDEGALYELIYNLASGCWSLQQLEAL
jgi:hypothetical protein